MLKSNKSFTIIELLVVMGVIAVLIGMSVYGIQAVQKATRVSRANDVALLMKAKLEAYYNEFRQYPVNIGHDMSTDTLFLCKVDGVNCSNSTDTDVYTTLKIDQPGLFIWIKYYFNDKVVNKYTNEPECNDEITSGIIGPETWQIYYVALPVARPQEFHLATCTESGWKDLSNNPAPNWLINP